MKFLIPLLLSATCGASVIDIEAAVRDCLAGGPSTAADIQRHLSDTLRWADATEQGLIVTGEAVFIQELPLEKLAGDMPETVTVTRFFNVMGQGPAPMRLWVEASPEERLYREVI